MIAGGRTLGYTVNMSSEGSAMVPAFVDVETTGLDPERHNIWEVAVVVGSYQLQSFVQVSLHGADPAALQVGRYYERSRKSDHTQTLEPQTLAYEIARVTSNCQIVGINPAFDVAFLTMFLRKHGQAPAWHYHAIDVKPLVVGWMRGLGNTEAGLPPWNTDQLARQLGIAESEFERHTALGDALLARAMYEVVMTL